MTAYDYSRPKASADRLIAKFGQAGTLRRSTSTGPAYNPTAGAPADYACTFVVDSFKAFEVDGTRVKASDLKVLLAKGSLAIEPSVSDKLLIGGVAHTIVNVEPLAPGGVTVMWTLQCRR